MKNNNDICSIGFDFNYYWEPFVFMGKHLTFIEHCNIRLTKEDCSHWGVAIYKWEGLVAQGEHKGKLGILIGETQDLRQRIKQYISGTQKQGNKYWREKFLSQGDIFLYVLGFLGGKACPRSGEILKIGIDSIFSKNIRVLIEQSLVLNELSVQGENRWVVNRQQ